MKIGIDARMLGFSGIGTFIKGLIDHLPKNLRQDILLFGDRSKLSAFGYQSIASSSPIYSIQEQLVLPSLYNTYGLDLLHVPHYNIPLLYRGKKVVTVHDLHHVLFPQFLPGRKARWYSRFMFKQVGRAADAVMTDSENTRRDFLAFVPKAKNVRVAHLGVDALFFERRTADQIKTAKLYHNLPQEYILYVGNIRRSKNIPVLLAAYRLLRKKTGAGPALVLVGMDFMGSDYWELHDDPDIVVREDIPLADLPAVYQGANMFVFPSLYEGFGLPPVEAMASGVPVICSNAGSLPEVVGDAAMMVEPSDVTALADAMWQVLTDEVLRQNLCRRGAERAGRFIWQETVQKYVSLYEEIISGRGAVS